MNQHCSGRQDLPEWEAPQKGPKQFLPSVLAVPPGTWQLLRRGRGQRLVVCALHSPGTGLLADELLSINLLHAVRAMGGRPAARLPLPTHRTVSLELRQSPCVYGRQHSLEPCSPGSAFCSLSESMFSLEEDGRGGHVAPQYRAWEMGPWPCGPGHASGLLGH